MQSQTWPLFGPDKVCTQSAIGELDVQAEESLPFVLGEKREPYDAEMDWHVREELLY